MSLTKPSAKDRSGVQSVEQGMRVARVFVAAQNPLPLKYIARLSGLGPSAAHRYLVSLVRTGLLIQLADGRYDLGPLALQFGFAGLSRLDAVEVAATHLRQFVSDTGTTGMLSVWSERGPMVVRWIQGARPVFTTIAVGSLLPLDESATGQIFRAFGGQPDSGKRRRSGAMGTIDAVRSNGLAAVAGDLVPGLHAAAVPVFDGTGTLAIVLTAVSAASPLPESAVAALRHTAGEASAALGHIIELRKDKEN